MQTKTYFTVTAIVKHNDKVLILKKADDDRNYPGRWGFCSGFVKEFEAGEDTILREIKEETGLNAKIIKTGKVIEAIDLKNREHPKKWVVGSYLCEVNDNQIKLCDENQDYKWVKIEELKDYEFVPGLTKNLKSLDLM